MFVKLTDEKLDINEALEHVRHASCGAVSVFEGNIREENDGEQVSGLIYEVYDVLFHRIVEEISAEIKAKWKIHEIALLQRTGRLEVGDTGIIIAVSSGHRRDSLEALTYAIEEFKKRAPVWKKELTADASKWINWPKDK